MRKLLLFVVAGLLALGSTVGFAGTAAARPGISDGGGDDQARYGRCLHAAMRTIVIDAMRDREVRTDRSKLAGAMAEADSRCQPGSKDRTATSTDIFDGLGAVAVLACEAPPSLSGRAGSIFSLLAFRITCQEPAER
jgi:hypothetical protein